jgi:membrane fusion protein (multidrug efflux system)
MPYDDAHGPDGLAEAQPDERARNPIRADAPTREREKQPRERQPEKPEQGDDSGSGGDAKSEDKGTDKKGDGDGKEQKRRGMSPILRIVLILVLLAAIAGGVYYWYSTRNLETTDDAYTDGRTITIAPKVSGYVVALEITDNQFVKAGQVLVRIDQRDFIAARDQAQGALMVARAQLANAAAGVQVAQKNFPARYAAALAQRDSARAALARAQADARRQHSVDRAATSQQAIDEANAAMLEAQAQVAQAEAQVQEASPVQPNIEQANAGQSQLEGQVKQAQAQLDQAELNLGYTVITAPQDGWVTRRNVERGNYLNAGGSIMSLVSPEVWITANFKENQLARMRPGERADIRIDAYPSLKLHGHVDSVQLGSGSKFSAFPAENATGNYVKIVQRVPVKILIDEGLDPTLPLPLGLSADPTIYLK